MLNIIHFLSYLAVFKNAKLQKIVVRGIDEDYLNRLEIYVKVQVGGSERQQVFQVLQFLDYQLLGGVF